MGSLRFLFALAVIFAHAGVDAFVGSRNAVQLFYVISGFLISYVLVERGDYAHVGSFYLNRFLRLYPIYFAIALATLVAVMAGLDGEVVDVFRDAPSPAKLLLVFANLSLVGQDWVMFTAVQSHELVFATDFRASEIPLWRGLLVPQAWSLGVELTFYVVAPYLLVHRRRLFGALALSALVRAFTWVIGLGANDPWSYRFFPSELALFLLGALAHQLLLPAYKRCLVAHLDHVTNGAVVVLLSVALFYTMIPASDAAKTSILLPLFILLMPFAFLFQQRYRLDSQIGDLSYPLYIGHWLVIQCVRPAFVVIGIPDGMALALVAGALSVALALLLNAVVGTRVERLRTKIRSRHDAEAAVRSHLVQVGRDTQALGDRKAIPGSTLN